MKKTTKLMNLLKAESMTRFVGAHSGLAAKLIENSGFDAIWVSGFEIATKVGIPDTNILTSTELATITEEISCSSSLPLLVDIDSGYGNCHNVIRTVNILERRGATGICIEDKLYPKVNSFINCRQDLIEISTFCNMIKAAKDTSQDKDFVIVARIEAFIANMGVEEALDRAHRYKDAGADALFIHSKKSDYSEIQNFMSKWNGEIPIIIAPTTYPQITIDDMQKMNVYNVIYANHLIRGMVKAAKEILKILYNSESSMSIEKRISVMDEIFELQNMKEFLIAEKKYS